ncbi:MAG: hypothetical protein AABY22_18885 [Nanoarchaeota archaeon]
MIDQRHLIIWVNLRHYFDIELTPILQIETDEYINICSLVDSTDKKVVDSVHFKSDFLVPILKEKNTPKFKLIAQKLNEIATKNHVYPVSADQMPKSLKQKGKKLYEKKA